MWASSVHDGVHSQQRSHAGGGAAVPRKSAREPRAMSGVAAMIAQAEMSVTGKLCSRVRHGWASLEGFAPVARVWEALESFSNPTQNIGLAGFISERILQMAENLIGTGCLAVNYARRPTVTQSRFGNVCGAAPTAASAYSRRGGYPPRRTYRSRSAQHTPGHTPCSQMCRALQLKG